LNKMASIAMGRNMIDPVISDHFRRIFDKRLSGKVPDNDRLTAAGRLMEKQREMEQMEVALKAHKQEFKTKMEGLQKKREVLVEKEYQLKRSFLKFDKFLKENDAKRSRALLKVKEERIARKVKEDEIKKLKEDMETLISYRDKMRKKLERYSKYRSYLDAVFEVANQFQEIRDVIKRHETLVSIQNDLIVREGLQQDKIEQEKANFNHYVKEKNHEIMNYNILLAQLQTKLEKTQSRAMYWESKWTRIQDTAANRTLKLGRIKMSTHNLVNVINRNDTTGITNTESTEKQLTRIQTFITDLAEIVAEAKSST